MRLSVLFRERNIGQYIEGEEGGVGMGMGERLEVRPMHIVVPSYTLAAQLPPP